jgi:hypothetical protein
VPESKPFVTANPVIPVCLSEPSHGSFGIPPNPARGGG